MIVASLTYQCRWQGKIVERGVVFNAGQKTFYRFTENSLHLVKDNGTFSFEDYTVECILKAAKNLGIRSSNFKSPWMPDMYDREVQFGLKLEVHWFDRMDELQRRPISDQLVNRFRKRFAAI